MWLVCAPVPTPNRERPGGGWAGLWGGSWAAQRPQTISPHLHLAHSTTRLLSGCPSEAVTAGAPPAWYQIHTSEPEALPFYIWGNWRSEQFNSHAVQTAWTRPGIQTHGGLKPNSLPPPSFILPTGNRGGPGCQEVLCALPHCSPGRLLGDRSQNEPAGNELMMFLDEALG